MQISLKIAPLIVLAPALLHADLTPVQGWAYIGQHFGYFTVSTLDGQTFSPKPNNETYIYEFQFQQGQTADYTGSISGPAPDGIGEGSIGWKGQQFVGLIDVGQFTFTVAVAVTGEFSLGIGSSVQFTAPGILTVHASSSSSVIHDRRRSGHILRVKVALEEKATEMIDEEGKGFIRQLNGPKWASDEIVVKGASRDGLNVFESYRVFLRTAIARAGR